MIERLWSSNSGLKPADDTFNGGFIVALAEGQDVIGAVTFVSGYGALSVKLHEAQTSIPTSIDVDKFLKARFGQLACLHDFRNPSSPRCVLLCAKVTDIVYHSPRSRMSWLY